MFRNVEEIHNRMNEKINDPVMDWKVSYPNGRIAESRSHGLCGGRSRQKRKSVKQNGKSWRVLQIRSCHSCVLIEAFLFDRDRDE